MVAAYACTPQDTRGRLYPETESAFRSVFQRDRDRIIHASAFRRLKHKTQVFVEHEGDYFRTRLTHSIEVAQVARTIAGALELNGELTEAVALAHDLGHTPFGHTGEDALAELMAPYGGFDHNAQAIRIVTSLERHYAEWDGLNLTWETLEGIAKHNGPVTPLRGDGPVTPLRGDGPVTPLRGDGPVTSPQGEPADTHTPAPPVPYALQDYNALHDLELATHASAEAQVAALSDDIAYNHHDIHDGLRAGLFGVEDLMELPIVGACFREVDARYPDLAPDRRRHEALRRFFGVLVEDVIGQARANLAQSGVQSCADVRAAGRMMVQFTPDLWADLKQVRRFLFTQMYRAPSVVKMRAEVTQVVKDLFAAFMADPAHLPQEWRADVARAQNDQDLARIVSDYLSGMTDRFALLTHERIMA